MVDILFLLETIAFLEKVGIIDHLDKALLQEIQCIFQSLEQELVGHGMVARSHNGEMHLVRWATHLPVDERHDAKHDVVVVRPGMVNDLVFDGLDTATEFGFRVVNDMLHGIETQIGNLGAADVVLQVIKRQFMGIAVKDFAKAYDRMFGLFEGPRAFVKIGRVGFVEHITQSRLKISRV